MMIFTRYLYVKDEVKLSLLISILNRKKSILFWTYELYYSGFEEELFEYLFKIYYDFYYTINPSFLEYFIKNYKIWKSLNKEDEERDIIVGMIAKNISIRNYNLDVFMSKIQDFHNPGPTFSVNEFKILLEERNFKLISDYVLNKRISISEIIKTSTDYFTNKKIIKKLTNWNKVKGFLSMNEEVQIFAWIMCNYQQILKDLSKKIYIVLNKEEIKLYKTIEKSDEMKRYRILENACLFEIDEDNYLSLFELERDELFKEKYWYNWLYYASFTPLWKTRIDRYGGIINEEKKEINFIDEDEFYDNYNYEPDEQSIEVQEKSIKEIKNEKTWQQFYEEKKSNNLIDNIELPLYLIVQYC